ncbi:hypothetical protein HanHA300_Chr12g0441221 [Helianthus annuus]|nr:hypothetical protein HanHA300_Chr12g0441221 [Helianthus annuus]KAJ0505066.1 hypothetical protein HanHA89_Chr12g0466321 [Helianthus annuus]KAJ0674753.1 hypothetical protein HanLR1_Chr12g0443471 [Helianthus annuus]
MWSCVCMCDQVTPPICCNDGRSSIEQDTRLKHLFPEDCRRYRVRNPPPTSSELLKPKESWKKLFLIVKDDACKKGELLSLKFLQSKVSKEDLQ